MGIEPMRFLFVNRSGAGGCVCMQKGCAHMQEKDENRYERLYCEVERIRRALDSAGFMHEKLFDLLQESVKQTAAQRERLRMLSEQLLQALVDEE